MSTRVTGAAAPTAPNAQGPGASNPSASARFRAALDRAKTQTKPDDRKAAPGRDPRKDKPSAARDASLEAQGGLVITPMGIASHPSAAALKCAASAPPSASVGARAERAAALEAMIDPTEGPESLAITDVRVGRGGGAVRVHATLAQGEHQGVELRAVEKNGRIEVELRAADGAAAERLRGEVGALRESLEAQGIERVAVAVVDASRSAGGSHGFSQDESRRQRQDSGGEEGGEPVAAARAGAARRAPEGDDRGDDRGEESGDGRALLL